MLIKVARHHWANLSIMEVSTNANKKSHVSENSTMNRKLYRNRELFSLCKKHYLGKIKAVIREEMRRLYRLPDLVSF